MILDLPWPPSTNTLYATVNNRRVLTKKGRLYHDEVGKMLMPYKSRYHWPMEGRLKVRIHASAPDKRTYDIGERHKCLLDALQKAQVYVNDSQIDDLHITRKPPGAPGYVTVRIQEQRRCLNCDRLFWRDAPDNALCVKCNKDNERSNVSDEEPHDLGLLRSKIPHY